MKIRIGAENIISPLGMSAKENFSAVAGGRTAIRKNCIIPGHNKPATVAMMVELPEVEPVLPDMSKIEAVSGAAIAGTLSGINLPEAGKMLFILSTTKGDIDKLNIRPLPEVRPSFLGERLLRFIPADAGLKVISLACISGLLSIIHASDLIRSGRYDSVLVLGVDLVTRFTLSGFESFFALSADPCRPYDKNRDGLNLGEAAASVFLSKNENAFKEQPLIFEGGASSNDANHISGPSRTGEGLLRAINRALKITGTKKENIDFISSHGTATRYNDDMESIAFHRAGLADIPLSSFKGFFGHTLGAAGVLESALSMQSIRNNLMIRNYGMNEQGTAKNIHVLQENRQEKINIILKTASGFGGSNAAGIIKNADLK